MNLLPAWLAQKWPQRPSIQRWALWFLLIALVAALLATLVWLARGHELEQMQRALDRDNADAAADLRRAFARNAQTLHGLRLETGAPAALDDWRQHARRLLDEHPEWLRLEWRNARLALLAAADSPYSAPLSTHGAPALDAAAACHLAARQGSPAYAPSQYMPQQNGLGQEVMALCVPVDGGHGRRGYAVAVYSLGGVLAHLLDDAHTRRQQTALTEADGTRLAVRGHARRGSRIFTSRQILDLPGAVLVLRMDGWRMLPDLFPNLLTALVTALTIALLTVLGLLLRDLRRRQQAEHALAEALAFRKAMEDSLVTGLRARDREGRITYVNPAFCAMVGYSADELLGHGMPYPYWPPERAHEYGQRQAVRLAGGLRPEQEGVEGEFQRRDGTRFPVLIIEAPLIDAAGRQTGWMSAFVDLSEQRRMEALSRASQERLQATARLATVGEMASLLSHELNQPLAVIASYATGSLNLLDAAVNGPAPSASDSEHLRTALARIAEQASRAGRVIHSVHDAVRRGSSARRAVAPQALVDAVLPLVRLHARQLHVAVQADVPPTLPAVWCDPTMIEQVLLNLARNALQAMSATPAPLRRLHLAAGIAQAADGAPAPGPAHVTFSVADHGSGISDAVAAQLFTPFFTTKAEGMGMGLSLCRTVVEQHGGRLTHAPHAPQGTVFRFTLPVAPPAAP